MSTEPITGEPAGEELTVSDHLAYALEHLTPVAGAIKDRLDTLAMVHASAAQAHAAIGLLMLQMQQAEGSLTVVRADEPIPFTITASERIDSLRRQSDDLARTVARLQDDAAGRRRELETLQNELSMLASYLNRNGLAVAGKGHVETIILRLVESQREVAAARAGFTRIHDELNTALRAWPGGGISFHSITMIRDLVAALIR
jgi:hypothetical protein